MAVPTLLRLALTLGDPNGIGPEVVLKALADPLFRDGGHHPVVVGSAGALAYWAKRLGQDGALDGVEVQDVGQGEVTPGRVTADGGRMAMEAVARACDLCMSGDADAMVTAPLHKEAIQRAGYAFPGHTEFLAERTGASEVVMLMASGPLRVGLVTTHVPLRLVATSITVEAVLQKLRQLHRSLRADFAIDQPRIAVLGLNPHAGDGGVLGTEEIDTIEPALAAARAEGIEASGPFPADAFFGRQAYREHDAVLAMYHDQGLVAFKALAMGRGVNVTLGLPIVRTSPDHGTAFDIAGSGRADASSFLAAAVLAADVARARRAGGHQRETG
jgi:4-hydroxythreonine-4-phosphate dehydrogenase